MNTMTAKGWERVLVAMKAGDHKVLNGWQVRKVAAGVYLVNGVEFRGVQVAAAKVAE